MALLFKEANLLILGCHTCRSNEIIKSLRTDTIENESSFISTGPVFSSLLIFCNAMNLFSL